MNGGQQFLVRRNLAVDYMKVVSSCRVVGAGTYGSGNLSGEGGGIVSEVVTDP